MSDDLERLPLSTDAKMAEAVRSLVASAHDAGAKVLHVEFLHVEKLQTISIKTSPHVDIEPFRFLRAGTRRLTPEEREERRQLWNNPEERARIRALPPLQREEVLAALKSRMRTRAKGITPGPFPSRKRFRATFGYTIEQLRAHLQRRFTDGMSWGNMEYWHIDHIRPLASFTITGVKCPEFAKAWALENLQPLWGRDNSKKGARWQP